MITTITVTIVVLMMAVVGVVCQDYRNTVVKLGYGVVFDKVDHIIGDGGASTYTPTWYIDWPVVPDLRLPEFDCANATTWESRCLAINSYIQSVNNDTSDRLDKVRQWIDEALKLVPVYTNTSTDNETGTPGSRSKRDVNEYDPDLPDWLKQNDDDDQTLRHWENFLPGHIVGHIFSSLFRTPSQVDLYALQDHLSNVGKAVWENVEAIE